MYRLVLLLCFWGIGYALIASDTDSLPQETADTIRVRLVHKARFPDKKAMHLLQVDVKKTAIEDLAPDSAGVLMLTGLKPGKYDLYISGPGFRDHEAKLNTQELKKGDTLKINLTPVWVYEPVFTLNFAQNAFGNYWQSGGINSLAIRSQFRQSLTMKLGRQDWSNDLNLVYGFIRQGDNEMLKNEDRIDLTSKYGVKVSNKMLFTTLLNFRTFFHDSYTINKDGTRGKLIANFFSPAFINLGTGLDYKQGKAFSVYYSPLNTKMTIVNDSTLGPQYLPAEFVDDQFRLEIGSYLNLRYKHEIMKNVVLESKADVFANALQLFNTVDVNWENTMVFKVNKYITASILAHMIYDEDIRFVIVGPDGTPERDMLGNLTNRKGPRTQFRQSLNIGLTHTF
jgi:hypothetical protein